MRDGGGLVLELATYLDRDPELVRARCQTAVVELAWLWPQFAKDPLSFYRTTDLYLFDLTKYQTECHDQGWYKWLEGVVKDLNPVWVLDFGGGIGEGLLAVRSVSSAKLYYQDVAESPTWNYAQHRFKKHEVDVESFHESRPIPSSDLCICMDVLEHIADPVPIIILLAQRCKHLICNAHHTPSGMFFPQHISKPRLAPHFTNLGGDLWQSNRK